MQAAGFLRDEATIAHVSDALAELLVELTACSSSSQGQARTAQVRPESAHMWLRGPPVLDVANFHLGCTVAAEHVCADQADLYCTTIGM